MMHPSCSAGRARDQRNSGFRLENLSCSEQGQGIEEARNTPAVAAHLNLAPEGEQEPLVLPGPVPPPPPRPCAPTSTHTSPPPSATHTSPPTSATCLTQADLSRTALKRRSATASHFIITFNFHLGLNSHACSCAILLFQRTAEQGFNASPMVMPFGRVAPGSIARSR